MRPGDEIGPDTAVHTGESAALVLKMPEGSLIRLGAKSVLDVGQLAVNMDEGRISVRSVLRVVDGFFRFATSSLAKATGQREISVGLRTATIGIRGTDFWAMSDDKHDAACLFEGQVGLATRDQGDLVLDQPTAFWAHFFDKPVAPVGTATPTDLQRFIKSVDIVPGQGVAVDGGAWTVEVMAGNDSRAALQLAGTLRQRGFAAQMRERAGRAQVVIAQLASREDAEALLAKLADVAGAQPRVLPPSA